MFEGIGRGNGKFYLTKKGGNETQRRPQRIVDIGGVHYKLNRIVDKTETDIHHIMGKCNKSKYNVGIEENKIRISRKEHIALNNYFENKQSPREQLKKVYETVKSVLSEGVRKELYTILYEADDDLFYIPELLKGKKKKQKTDTNSNNGESVKSDCK